MIEWLGTSCFSFLEGVAEPDVLIERARELGYAGLGLGDRMGLYGLVRAFRAAKETPDFFFAPGIRLHFDSADPLFIYPLHKKAHARLCRFLSAWALDGMKVGEKGLSPLPWRTFLGFLRESPEVARDFVLISVSGRFYLWPAGEESRLTAQEVAEALPTVAVPPQVDGVLPFWLIELAQICGKGEASALSLTYPLTLAPGAEDLCAWLERASEELQIPLLATTLPLMTEAGDQDLCDLASAIRYSIPVKKLGYLRQANAERRLLDEREREFFIRKIRAKNFAWDPFQRGHVLAERHAFSLSELKYRYPRENIPAGETPSSHLRKLAWAGADFRYGGLVPESARAQVEKELDLIAELGFEDYFLTIYDVLDYARKQGILFQGRGSAANSAVCFCLGITSIDPVRMDLLFERFLSRERNEPPDIDVDFEHDRREEVMQEVYRRYGREHAAMVASVIKFRGRSAVRETAKAMGVKKEVIDELVSFMGREGMSRLSERPATPAMKRVFGLAERLRGLPRHMGLHTGGFVLSSERLSEECILEPARMENRSIVPWDKDDVEVLGWMKVDLLSLGMLSAIRRCFDLVARNGAPRPALATIPAECPTVYAAIRRADTVGVFQIESRAQMNMLPRLAPRNFYDLVIEIAIVRPGPLQGGMVHPYLKRRQNPKLVVYDHPDLIPILKKTLGIPIFQEQVMKVAIAVAGFTPGEADKLRKVMSGAWHGKSSMSILKEKLFRGMAASGLPPDLAERLYRQIEGFGEYGFPESHSASFAILTYASMWLKVWKPSEFLCALLNSQPMGFYSPRALVADAERHGVRVLNVDIFHSDWESILTENPQKPDKPFVRLGLHLVEGLKEAEAREVLALRRRGSLNSLESVADLRERGLSPKIVEKLVRANACRGIGDPRKDSRREQLWNLWGVARETAEPVLVASKAQEVPLQDPSQWESSLQDAATVGLTPGHHLAQTARESFLHMQKWTRAYDLYRDSKLRNVRLVGLLAIKQRPPTAGGLCFLTLEDETGFFNLVLMPDVYERYRMVLQTSTILAAEGTVERSLRIDPEDPFSAAVSIKVRQLWNPLLAPEHSAANSVNHLKPRDFH